MQFIADLHIHSKYSRATSSDMDVDHMNKWARVKGIKVIGTGDFTHPLWLKELKDKLEPAETGLLKLKKKKKKIKNHDWLPTNGKDKKDDGTRFMLSGEVSCVYTKDNKTRKIHMLIYAPDFKTVEKINTQLGWTGNIKADGRPILGLDAQELVKIVLNSSSQCLIMPAHIWTPSFSLFGASSGFDSIKECFEDYSKHIHASETGLSSDPAMNWRLISLDKITLLSNSDAHNPSQLGRKANVFDLKRITYRNIVEAIKNGCEAEEDGNRLISTIEYFPEVDKYYLNGHHKCGVVSSPIEIKKGNNICPKCSKPLTIGVLHRLNELADREHGQKPQKTIAYQNLVPLEEVIADSFGVSLSSKRVREEYKNLIKRFGTEFNILLNVSQLDIEQVSSAEIGEGVIRAREGRVHIEPGYDGQIGKINVFKDGERDNLSKQTALF